MGEKRSKVGRYLLNFSMTDRKCKTYIQHWKCAGCESDWGKYTSYSSANQSLLLGFCITVIGSFDCKLTLPLSPVSAFNFLK